MPEMLDYARYYWNAFLTLSMRRTVVMGAPAPISMSEILAYVEFHKIDHYQARCDLLRVITTLDQEYMRLASTPKPSSTSPAKRGK